MLVSTPLPKGNYTTSISLILICRVLGIYNFEYDWGIWEICKKSFHLSNFWCTGFERYISKIKHLLFIILSILASFLVVQMWLYTSVTLLFLTIVRIPLDLAKQTFQSTHWTLLDFFKTIQTSLDPFGSNWTSLNLCGPLWTSVDLCGHLWTSVDLYRPL